MTTAFPLDRATLVTRSRHLAYATMAYNTLEGVLAVVAGLMAGSIALIGFGIDSFVELAAGGAALWRLRADVNPRERERAERLALRMIGLCFLALSVYIAVDAGHHLLTRLPQARSWLGIVIGAASLVTMPFLARAKGAIARQLHSGALAAEAKQTLICSYLSAILVGGLLLNALLGWWWADPVAALAMVPFIAWEGIEGVGGRSTCGQCG